MAEFEFDAAPWALPYVRQIVAAMVELFGMSRKEAVGRVNRQWAGQSLRTGNDKLALWHQDPEWWAKTIGYGPDSLWWLDEENTPLRPYP